MRTITVIAVAAAALLAGCATSTTPTGTAAGSPAAQAPTPVPTAVVPASGPSSPAPGGADLLARVRLDLQGTCTPLATGLPATAVAGIECTPASEVVAHARVLAFDTQAQLLDAYVARLAAQGIAPTAVDGGCIAGVAGEGAYWPGDGQPDMLPGRQGCWVDEAGIAHWVATQPPFVLMELDGTGRDMSLVTRYGWLGNQDAPGSPTLWRESGPASPEK